MPHPASESASQRQLAALTTSSVISFSLTLLVGALVLLTGKLPLPRLSATERLDVVALLFMAPVIALVLAVVFEATRIALKSHPLPEPRRTPVTSWTPGRGEG